MKISVHAWLHLPLPKLECLASPNEMFSSNRRAKKQFEHVRITKSLADEFKIGMRQD